MLAAERAHTFVTTGLDLTAKTPLIRLIQRQLTVHDARLHTTIAGVHVTNPVGLAAGFDKNATHIHGMAALGFGFLEIGTVTPIAQIGNPKPRLFRLPDDQALINRMGFNNAGIDVVAQHLAKTQRPVPLGINIGKNKHTPNEHAAADYVRGIEQLAPFADYMVVNISSPNTPNLRALSRREPLLELLQAVQTARSDLSRRMSKPAPPLFVKLSPDEDLDGLDAALHAALESHVDGLIATNTTVSRVGLRSQHQHEIGGLSGAPLRQQALDTLRYIYSATRGNIALIGVGGIDSAESAYERIRAGANVVQLYTGLIYQGATLVHDINYGLIQILERDGFNSIQEAVGKK